MKKRIAVIDRELCRFDKCNLVCISKCPIAANNKKAVYFNEEKNIVAIDEDLCIGCGICIKVCPFDAIRIVNFPKPLDQKPIHRFGINGFELYNLPFPIENKIVGIIGPNGIGKTSSLKILIGEIKPNFGEIDKEYEISDLIKIFRGKEIQNYLEKLKENKVRLSYKPQRVDLIPKLLKGKVKDIIDSLKEDKEKIFLILNEFGISILEKNIENLSGGELQALAISISLAKNADFYYFDEPTTFLDISQRFNLINIFRRHLKDKSSIIVDHDIAFLDALCDYIHIFYGMPSVYGIVSNLLSARVGINNFFEGYIKEENIKFRDFEIKFEKTQQIQPKNEILIKIENFEKKLDSFKLFVESFEIRKKEIIGVIGANALGKTTFAKILAKEIESNLNLSISISYKPQFINIDFDGSVEEYLNSIKKIGENEIKEIIFPLNLQRILLKNIKNLSGGEMQRVAIAACLLKDSDLYILDEPSAFLDIEERISLIKNLKDFIENREKSFLVIDHDLTFISYISHRILLFKGNPGTFGKAKIYELKDGINEFLKEFQITFRKDKETNRPRINKFDSKIDREQKEKGIYFDV
ncbi:MAG: ribosome biogenesis/translation initiation ATPase RLI [Candidatus Aenigmarchaeota archaeon]|nr:ribosome biogenesis/translation initiation ATPase RLI [Candidatus Aenigmarchaeota archaeon]